ncbi:hypothetical protein Y032_0030g2153 [Ancylostoma ceylanicum]|uniref:Uncharacterized protein n=1 Tax=Ancylostoma ceylanicum TaxID=53326 RepID=A0A016UQZ5_9BILA|nr:hypothetical protein Y032_0030g2153 [Ancylostoma ceylanicum]
MLALSPAFCCGQSGFLLRSFRTVTHTNLSAAILPNLYVSCFLTTWSRSLSAAVLPTFCLSIYIGSFCCKYV